MSFIEGRKEIRQTMAHRSDPTARIAIDNVDSRDSNYQEELDRFQELLDHIYYICELAGYQVESHIVLKDTKTGRVWK